MYDHPSFVDYADLLVRTGLGLVPGDRLLVSTSPGTWGFARLVAERAYAAGAHHVAVDVRDDRLVRARAAHAPPETWDDAPPFDAAIYGRCAAERWARIAIEPLEDLEELEGVDAAPLGAFARARAAACAPYREAMMADRFPWVVAACPGPRWAARLGLGSAEELWDVLRPILRLDQPDPAAAWREHGRRLEERARRLDGAGLRALRFVGPGTDLRVGLSPAARWLGGPARTPEGRVFLPNVPTEEVFATPDWRAVEGTARVTRPVEVLGAMVEGAWLSFAGGRVVACGAARGEEHLRRFLDTDEGARSLGEVALVDEESPVARSGRVFGSGLLDENASCHVALGAGYPAGAGLAEGLDADAQRARGCNASLVHVDFMIGGPEVSVWGATAAGEEVELLREGRPAGVLRG